MDSVRREAQNDVAVRNTAAVNHLTALYRTNRKACEIELAVAVHAGHLGGLAADKRAAGLTAPIRDTGDHGSGDIAFEMAGREVIKKEERFRTLHDKIVDAHCNKIDADGVVNSRREREL